MAKKLSAYEKETTRPVTLLDGTKIRVRKIEPSGEAIKGMGLRTKQEIVGHMAINPPEIENEIRMIKARILREMTMMRPSERMLFCETPIDFVPDKENRKKYWIICSRCEDKVAYVWADNEKLDNWCDLHYVCWFNKESWHGAAAINVSPIDGKLGIECACGEDTRDFRAARGIPPIQKELLIDYTLKHRDFGVPTSKFLAINYG